MQRSKKAPTSEVIRNASDASASPRRDDRAEPDDDRGSSRIEVVNVDVGRADNPASGMVSLRRELAKLHQQAAAVERSLEEQRRDRTDSLDRLERANEHALALEARLRAAEGEASSLRKMHEASVAELLKVREERDDLALAVESAKVSTAELGKLESENRVLRARAEASHRAGGELFEAKQATTSAVTELKRAKLDLEKARKALDLAEEDAAMVGGQASKIREEATKLRADAEEARAEATKATAELAKARAQATSSASEIAKARAQATTSTRDLEALRASSTATAAELETLRASSSATAAELATLRATSGATAAELEEVRTRAAADIAKLAEDLARAKADNARDRETARDRIDLLERAIEDARAAITRTEAELEAARSSEERLGRQLEASQRAASEAESRASSTQMAHATLEHSVRRLHEEIAGAFARVATPLAAGAPPNAPSTASAAPGASAPPNAHLDSASPSPPSPSPLPFPSPVESLPPDALVSLSPDAARAHDSVAPTSASPVSRSVPPPVTGAPSPLATLASTPPPPLDAPSLPQVLESLPDELPAIHESMPPSDGWSEPPPPTRRPTSAAPPGTAPTRDELLARLVDPDHMSSAVAELQLHPEWLRSVPPPALIAALATVDYDADSPIFELARAWDREPLCHSLVASLRSSSEPRAREHSAWLLKHLAAPSSWKAIADLARSDSEPLQLRRWLLEALDRLAAGRAVGWRELGDVITGIAKHSDATLRDGVVGILVSLERSEDKRKLLLEILRADDDEVVLASAVNALASVLPMELDPSLVERLLGNPSPRVQRSVRDLIERAKRA